MSKYSRGFTFSDIAPTVLLILVGLLMVGGLYIEWKEIRLQRECVLSGYSGSYYNLRKGSFCMKVENGTTVVRKMN